MPTIGDLRHRVAVEAPPSGQDAYGDATGAWTNVFNAWAEILPVSGNEAWAEQAIQAEANSKITMRFRDGVTEKMRVNWTRTEGGTSYTTYYDIVFVQPWRQHRKWMTLVCRSGVNDG